MDNETNVLQLFTELAAIYERRGQAQMRDRFLVLAADAALSADQKAEAERLRDQLLQVNPHHMLKPYGSFREARQAPDVDTYIRNLRLNYPLEAAQELLRKLQTGEAPATKLPPKTTLPPENDEEQTLAFPRAGAKPTEMAEEDDLEKTAGLPLSELPPSRSSKRGADLAQTAHFPVPPLPRPLMSKKKEPDATEAGSKSGTAADRPGSKAGGSAAARPASPQRPAAPKAPSRPASSPSPFAPFGNDPAPTVRSARHATLEEEAPEDGGWLASVLLVLVGVTALAWAGFTVARPFLPDGWLSK